MRYCGICWDISKSRKHRFQLSANGKCLYFSSRDLTWLLLAKRPAIFQLQIHTTVTLEHEPVNSGLLPMRSLYPLIGVFSSSVTFSTLLHTHIPFSSVELLAPFLSASSACLMAASFISRSSFVGRASMMGRRFAVSSFTWKHYMILLFISNSASTGKYSEVQMDNNATVNWCRNGNWKGCLLLSQRMKLARTPHTRQMDELIQRVR